MKKLFTLFVGASLLLASCGGEEEATTIEIDTKDIKGTIEAAGASTGNLSHSGDMKSEGKTIKLKGKGEISIYLSGKSIDEAKKDAEKGAFIEEFEFLSEEENGFLYREEKEGFGDKPSKEGYGFLVVVPYNGNYVHLRGNHEKNPFDPIEDKGAAEELYKIAKTFKAKE